MNIESLESTNYNIAHTQYSYAKIPKTSDRKIICIDFHKLSGIFSEHAQDTLGPYIRMSTMKPK